MKCARKRLKHNLEMKETRPWCKIILQIGVEQIQNNEKNYIYLYSFVKFVQKNSMKISFGPPSKEPS
jgi:hypothetical protein